MDDKPYCIVRPYVPQKALGMHHWRVSLGGLRVLTVARSHQAAKRVAVAYWSLSGEHFAKAVRARISEKWRGGLKARCEGWDLGAPPESRWTSVE